EAVTIRSGRDEWKRYLSAPLQLLLGQLCPLGAVGDVAAARDWAEALFTATGGAPERAGARLLLTAALVHLDEAAGPEPCLGDLVAFLQRAKASLANLDGFGRSASSLVRYAGAELQAAPESATLAADACLKAVMTIEL
ncbi:MAG TPA: hypothetical protein VME40_04830, partial [Caulobacteraceae bacterium]|nr:hypothetical protein [Caulobacteraceae bacterium]